MGHNFGMLHDDDCKSANSINREVYSSGCGCFNAFLNPNCRIVITLPNHNTPIIQMDQTLPFKLYSPVLISSKKGIFHCLLFRPFALCWRANLHRERETPGNEAASSMLPCSIFALFYFAFEGNFQVQAPPPSPPGRLYLEGRLNGGFFALRVWGAYFRNFTACRARN